MTFFQGVARSSNCAVDHQACLRIFRIEGIKKTPVLKREEVYRGPIEPGWGAGLLIPLREGEREYSPYDLSYAQEFPIRFSVNKVC
jgi:hypothetical protein